MPSKIHAVKENLMMSKNLLPLLGLLVSFAPSAVASSTVYVSANAEEPSTTCTRSLPCKTITQALSVVSAGGLVDVISSGAYDSFIVTKAVTVKADPGITATISVPSTTGVGVTVGAGVGDDVTISGLILRGPGTNGTGININSGRVVTVENCDSRAFAYGLAFVASGSTALKVKGGTFSGNDTGIYTAAAGSADIDGVTVFGVSNNAGIEASAPTVTITNSVLTGDPSGNIGVLTNAGTVVLEHDFISEYPNSGLYAGFSGAVTYLSSCTIVNNYAGISNAGLVYTRGNNTITANRVNFFGGTMTLFPAY